MKIGFHYQSYPQRLLHTTTSQINYIPYLRQPINHLSPKSEFPSKLLYRTNHKVFYPFLRGDFNTKGELSCKIGISYCYLIILSTLRTFYSKFTLKLSLWLRKIWISFFQFPSFSFFCVFFSTFFLQKFFIFLNNLKFTLKHVLAISCKVYEGLLVIFEFLQS